jgi:hypothetical protein
MRLMQSWWHYIVAWIILMCMTYTASDAVAGFAMAFGFNLTWNPHKFVPPIIVAVMMIIIIRYQVVVNVYVSKRKPLNK